MFVLVISEKINETRLNFYQEIVTVLWMMVSYQEARVKLTDAQLNKLKSEGKNKTGTILMIHKKNLKNCCMIFF